MHYYKFNIADYRKDTSHLSTLEHGIYRQLIDWYYLDEKPIPLETESVMRRLRLVSEDAPLLKNVLKDFFECRATGYHQLRCDMEINDYHHNAAINKENGKLGGRPKKTGRVISANRTESEPKGNHKPLTTNQEPLTNGVAKATVAKRRTQLSNHFEPDETGKQKASQKGLSWQEELTKFRDYHFGKGTTMLDWQAAWRTWISNARVPPPQKSGETAYQKAQREKMQQWAPGVAAKSPNQPFTLEAENVTFIEGH
jgi:uncharacterized protein YdaU (DUF1376 family)